MRVVTLPFTFLYSVIHSLRPIPCIYLHSSCTKWLPLSTLTVLFTGLCHKAGYSKTRIYLCCVHSRKGDCFQLWQRKLIFKHHTVCMCAHMSQRSCRSWLSPSIICVLRTELRLSCFQASALSWWAILLTQVIKTYSFKKLLRINSSIVWLISIVRYSDELLFPHGVRDIWKEAQVDQDMQCTFRSA